MSLGFRRWWQPPRSARERVEGRSVTFLELFFDLVFVVVIARLSESLAQDPTWPGVGRFVFLFVPVWSAWINGTFYHDLHGTNDVSTRVFTFCQMLTIAAMAVFIDDATGRFAGQFALAYAAHHFLLTGMWFRTGVHDPGHRSAAVRYSILYGGAAAVFAASAVVDGPARFWMWGIALAGEFLSPAALGRIIPDDIGFRSRGPSPAAIERFGLFVIIVLGEVIVGAIEGVSEVVHRIQRVEIDVVVTGGLGMLVAIGLWWVYFDFVSHRRPRPTVTALWVDTHFLVVVGVAATGAGVLNAVEHVGEPPAAGIRWLLVGAVAAALVGIALLMTLLEVRAKHPTIYRASTRKVLLAAAAACSIGLLGLGAKPTLALLVVMLIPPVIYGVSLVVRTVGRLADSGEPSEEAGTQGQA